MQMMTYVRTEWEKKQKQVLEGKSDESKATYECSFNSGKMPKSLLKMNSSFGCVNHHRSLISLLALLFPAFSPLPATE